MNEFGLVYGSIDLIIDKNDPLVFLEVNPSGDWAYIEGLTGLPITQTITNLIRAETTLCVVLDE
jgi:glutathione synthase/RimK-type ligase-like ATP-grasp enzyme